MARPKKDLPVKPASSRVTAGRKPAKIAASKVAPSEPTETDRLSALKKYRPSKKAFIVILLAGLLLLGVYKRGWFVAATVNGSPITNLELLGRLNSQYRTQTLEQMIDEKIIMAEAKRKKVTVRPEEIEGKVTELENRVGGKEALESLLAQQGQDRQGLKDQLKLQLTVEKLYESEATVSAEEVREFIGQNKERLEATDSAGQEKEAAEAIKQQRLGKVVREKFQELKSQARVKIF